MECITISFNRAKFVVRKAVLMKIQGFWDVAPCRLQIVSGV